MVPSYLMCIACPGHTIAQVPFSSTTCAAGAQDPPNDRRSESNKRNLHEVRFLGIPERNNLTNIEVVRLEQKIRLMVRNIAPGPYATQVHDRRGGGSQGSDRAYTHWVGRLSKSICREQWQCHHDRVHGCLVSDAVEGPNAAFASRIESTLASAPNRDRQR